MEVDISKIIIYEVDFWTFFNNFYVSDFNKMQWSLEEIHFLTIIYL